MLKNLNITLLQKTLTSCLAAAAVVGAWSHAGSPARAGQSLEVSFRVLDIYIDSGDVPLAAYQFELHDRSGVSLMVGVEGGEHQAFAGAPYYDPEALRQSERIIVAGYSLAGELPSGETRVATIHVQIDGGEPDFDLKLVVTAGPDGEPIEATIALEQGEAE